MSAAARAVPLWRESLVGGHKIRAACRFTVPPSESTAGIVAVGELLGRAGFTRADAPDGVIVLRRGSAVGDTILNGTGLSLLTSRLGPLSLEAVVVVEATPRDDLTEIVVSMVLGDELAPTVAEAVDAVIDGLVARGVAVVGAGWGRAVDLPAESLGNPKTAREHGLRR